MELSFPSFCCTCAVVVVLDLAYLLFMYVLNPISLYDPSFELVCIQCIAYMHFPYLFLILYLVSSDTFTLVLIKQNV